MLDLRILEFNYKFLRDLELKRKVKCSLIRVLATKRIDPTKTRGVGGSYTKSFKNILAISNTYPSIKGSLKHCDYGDSNLIENLYVENLSLPFPNKFKIYNISGSLSIVEDFQLNNYNDEFYKSEIKRFKYLMIEVFSEYIKSYRKFKKYIDDCYVDACYVDTNYNCPDNDDVYKSSTAVTYPDLFIDAGPDIDLTRGASVDFDITGATYAYFDGATYLWEIGPYPGYNPILSSSNAIIVPGTENQLEPKIRELGSPASPLPSWFPQIYQLTLTVTYPWGPVISDTRRIDIIGNYNYYYNRQ